MKPTGDCIINLLWNLTAPLPVKKGVRNRDDVVPPTWNQTINPTRLVIFKYELVLTHQSITLLHAITHGAACMRNAKSSMLWVSSCQCPLCPQRKVCLPYGITPMYLRRTKKRHQLAANNRQKVCAKPGGGLVNVKRSQRFLWNVKKR